MYPELVGVAFFAFLWGLAYIKMKKNQQKRDFLHRERMLAMEKGIPLPEFPDFEEDDQRPLLEQLSESTARIAPKLPLGCGLVLIFGGAGVLVALSKAQDPEFHRAWSLGFIPVFLGAGLILYYLLTRESKR